MIINKNIFNKAVFMTAFFVANIIFYFMPPDVDAIFLKQNTAVTVIVGPFLDKDDGITAETGITPGAQCDLIKNITKSDLTLTASGGDNDFVHVANGYWSVELTAGNTDTLGRLMLTFTDSAVFVPVWQVFDVVTANYYDSLFSTDVFDVSVTQWTGTAVATPATAGYPVVTLKDDAITSAKFDESTAYPLTNNTGTQFTALPWNTSWDTEVQSEAEDALQTYDIDHLTKSALPTGITTDVALNSVIGNLLDNGTSWTFDRTTDSVEAISNYVDDIGAAGIGLTAIPTVANVTTVATCTSATTCGTCSALGSDSINATALAANAVDEIWDEPMSGHTTDGTFGGDAFDADVWTSTKAGYLDEAISGIDDNPWDAGTRTLTALDEDSTTIDLNASYVGGVTVFDEDSTTIDIDGTTIGTATNLTNAPTAGDLTSTMKASVATAVWDAPLASHVIADTFGDIATVDDLVTEMWAQDKDSPTANSYGWLLNMLLDGTLGKMIINSTANTMTIYDYDSPYDAVKVYDLKDASGNESSVNVYQRIPQ